MKLGAVFNRIVTVCLLAVVVWGAVAGIFHGSPTDRAHEIASRLRCPLCAGESVADSPSGSARDIAKQVKDQIEHGWTDTQIEQFYVQRYGRAMLLDPPRSGGTLLLWAIPLIAVTGGGISVVSMLERSKKQRLLIWGTAAVGLTSLAAMIVLGLAQQETKTSAAPPPLAPPTTTRDLATVGNDEMEQVVAQNPTVIGMRLALAQRYLASGELDKAYKHTSTAIDLPATDQEYEHALRLHGWVTALRGGASSGAGYLRAALALSPDDRDALWFLARVEFSGLGDIAAARLALNQISQAGMTADQKSAFDQMSAKVDAALLLGASTPTTGEVTP